jgi:CheY-like chemotaxis protein/nitrogen-specific signal transduction histidine kinase/HPt (histidine-containing phosphotransfer) domain-containing protein
MGMFLMFCQHWNEGLRLEKIVHERTRELEEQTNAAYAAARTKGDFLARMSHEIRTPMNAIIGMSELALREEISPAALGYISEIRHAGANLLSIINDILDFSKVESGKIEIDPKPYMLASLLNDVTSVTQVRIAEKSLLFIANADANLPGNLIGDVARIRQVLLNVLSNAVKYTKEGYVMFSVSGKPSGGDEIELRFEIEDSGIGIKKEEMGELFGDFVRLDGELNRGVEGTGLGLAIASHLCELMNGKIKLSSVYGEGSVFTVTVPQRYAGGSRLAVVEDLKDISILLYDNRPLYAVSVLSSLENLRASVDHAENLDVFLSKLVSGEFQFAFISYDAVDCAVDRVKRHKLNTRIVLLAGLNEAPIFREIRTIAMPAYAVPIANVLNGLAAAKNREKGSAVRFTAPEACALVVDDNRTNLKVAQGLLMPYGIRADACESGEEALKLVRDRHYDLIFMDHMMPGMDGVETTARLRRLENCANVPIIALTANAVSGMREMFIGSGMDDFLSKPVDPLMMADVLLKWIPEAKRTVLDEPPSEDDRVYRWLPPVDGVDFDRAVERIGGSVEAYLDVVRSYMIHTPEILDRLRDPLPETIGDYAIAIHGIKGSSYNICADTVGKLAAELEDAAKAGDIATVRSKNYAFIVAAEKLIWNLRSTLESTVTDEKPRRDAPDRAVLLSILEACERYDVGTMQDALDELDRYSYEDGSELVVWLCDQLRNLEYDSIRGRLRNALDARSD